MSKRKPLRAGSPAQRAAMIACLKKTAKRLGRRPTRREFRHASGLSVRTIVQTFGTYHKLLAAGGYQINNSLRRIDDDTLLKGMRDAFKASGGEVVCEQFARFSRHDPRTLTKRWGGWTNALAALRDWLEHNEPGFVHLAALRQHCLGVKAPVRSPGGSSCGELLRFRALDHAPTSESAVIFLFGQVADELGFILDSVGTGFPDAVGRQRAGKGWRHVRIEFEHRSRNFREHGHDVRGCDLVVCWEDNWPECPVEVLELKRVIATLGKIPVGGGLTRGADAAPHTARHLTKTPGYLPEKVTAASRQDA